jgi:tRNA dimethylallyltransferase
LSGGVVYAIVGPTAAGKTKAAFELARLVGGEIISVDSRQIYRYMDVGTDKISPEERKIVPHHMIDVADPDEIFTAADFVERAADAVRRVTARGRIPILAGGTPMYYKALEGKMLSSGLPGDEKIREGLKREIGERGSPAMHEELRRVDPETAARVHPNDAYRIARALEIYRITGRNATALYGERDKIGGLNIRYFGIDAPRETLFKKIERRAAEQFDNGYPGEVKWLLDRGYSGELPSMRGFGYRELVMYFEGMMTLEEALNSDIRSTKAFSRRQMTWFKQFSPIVWYDFRETILEETVLDMARIILGGDSE